MTHLLLLFQLLLLLLTASFVAMASDPCVHFAVRTGIELLATQVTHDGMGPLVLIVLCPEVDTLYSKLDRARVQLVSNARRGL